MPRTGVSALRTEPDFPDTWFEGSADDGTTRAREERVALRRDAESDDARAAVRARSGAAFRERDAPARGGRDAPAGGGRAAPARGERAAPVHGERAATSRAQAAPRPVRAAGATAPSRGVPVPDGPGTGKAIRPPSAEARAAAERLAETIYATEALRPFEDHSPRQTVAPADRSPRRTMVPADRSPRRPAAAAGPGPSQNPAPAYRPPAGGDEPAAARRTVTIRGQVADRYTTSTRRRPDLPRHERPGFKPDRVAMWAVLLGFILVLVAATSAHAAMLVH